MFNSLAQTLVRSAPPRACRTRTRGPSCGTSAWSTRTTAGRWTTSCAASVLDGAGPAGRRRRDRAGPRAGRAQGGRADQAVRARRRPCGSAAITPDLFASGEYLPVDAVGPRAGHAFASLESSGDRAVLVLVPRLVAVAGPRARQPARRRRRLGRDRSASARPSCRSSAGRTCLTGETIDPRPNARLPVARVLGHFPVALLEGSRE